ncbi:hypothetical protein [Williamsoniiplasma lucivorax]|uniref:Uncharacterized protein n=1 Tax=Williamsoniiplasma lucivorax TaxID=209274 RepID=A0A2S5RCY7_9MOLU|nr:hypothetical protein [Williamsoniiplasma lucivorax]PPE05180.1 hypothetical protein ELUCI_v1c07160 [Williamsoniiplasma lucivorax]
MSINEQELELNFFEPALGLIITNLEFLEEELIEEKIATKKLKQLIDNFHELERIEDFDVLAETLTILGTELKAVIVAQPNLDQFKVMSYLDLAINLAQALKTDGQLSQIILEIANNPEVATEEDVIELTKEHVNHLLKANYLSIQEILDQGFKVEDAFIKILKILIKEDNFNEFSEGNSILIELLTNQFKLKNDNVCDIFNYLIGNEGIILLINFWQQGLIEMDCED